MPLHRRATSVTALRQHGPFSKVPNMVRHPYKKDPKGDPSLENFPPASAARQCKSNAALYLQLRCFVAALCSAALEQ